MTKAEEKDTVSFAEEKRVVVDGNTLFFSAKGQGRVNFINPAKGVS